MLFLSRRNNPAISVLLLTLLAGCASEDKLVVDSQGKIDLKATMKYKGEVFVPIDKLDKLDPEQLKGKRIEIIYGPRGRNQGKTAIQKGGTIAENFTAPFEENIQGVIITPETSETPPTTTLDK
jgi:hypothetical protein